MKTNILDRIAIDLCEQSYLNDRLEVQNFLSKEYGAYDIELHNIIDVDMQFITCKIGEDSWMAIRGTRGKEDILTDIDLSSYDPLIKKVILKKKNGDKWLNSYKAEIKRLKKLKRSMGLKHIHFGFFKCAEAIYKYMLDNEIHIDYLTGHSLGGGVSTLLAMFVDDLDGIITFGSPRVGGISFVRKYNKKYGKITKRFFNHMDIFPKVPLRIMFFMHVSRGYFFNRKGIIKKRVEQFRDFFDWSRKKDIKSIDVKKLLSNHYTPIYKKNVLKNMV